MLRRYIGPMKQPDSLLSPTRRTLLQAGLGATALFASPALAATPPGFDQWRDAFRARAQAKGRSSVPLPSGRSTTPGGRARNCIPPALR